MRKLALVEYIIPLLILMFISLTSIGSVASTFLSTQLVYTAVGLIIILSLSRIEYYLYLFSPWPWYVLSLVLLIITAAVGSPIRGSVRWISILGFQFQASEFVKPLLILFMASFLTQHFNRSFKSMLIFLGLMLVPISLILVQPDLGSAILIFIITFASLLAGGAKLKHLIVIILIGVSIIPIGFVNLKPYQKNRLISFIDPNKDPLGAGYNVRQAMIAVGSGKFFGRGLGQGTQSHLRFLPERQTDFIFASIVEELGFVGGILILFSYTWLAIIMIKTSQYASSDSGSIIVLAVLTWIMMQVIINIGMNMGVMPVTGITLPFVSVGGSSILSLSTALAICLNIALKPISKRPVLEIK